MKFIKAIGKIFKKRPLVVVVRLEGVIGAVSRFGSGGIDDSNTQKLLEKAFEFEKAKAIVLKINSPGGSPTQSSLIADRVQADFHTSAMRLCRAAGDRQTAVAVSASRGSGSPAAADTATATWPSRFLGCI